MGETQNQLFQFSFNRFLHIGFRKSRVTSDGNLLLVRDESLGLTNLIQNFVVDTRTGRNTRFLLADLFRQSAHCQLADYEDLNYATRVSRDPMFQRMAARLKLVDHGET